jgi:hypothetical protein
VPAGPTHFIRRPVVVEVDSLEDDLHRVESRAAVPPGRDWLATELLPQLLRERADDGLMSTVPWSCGSTSSQSTASPGPRGSR